MELKEEAEKILKLHGGDFSKSIFQLESQLNVVQSRAQVIVTLAGVVITVTGFSGRIIAATALHSQILIILGLLTVLASACYIVKNVMSIKWLTTDLDDFGVGDIEKIISRRNLKTKAYLLGSKMLFWGLALYCLAMVIMLLNPEPLAIAPR